MKIGRITSLYLAKAVLPYFLMAWLILTVILFIQQAGRYSEIFFSPNLPSTFAWQLAFALFPNVVAFTCPMAVLVGVIIGLSRMQIDNELIVIRSFGIGTTALLLPLLLLGVLLSCFSLFVNIYGVPLASRAVRSVAAASAIYKLESPIEPGVFNSEIAGFTIYVKNGDLLSGQWENVFVFSEDASSGTMRLITSKRGRIDSEGQRSELVLKEAVSATISETAGGASIASERVNELRISIRTRRDEMVERLNSIKPSMDELGLAGLIEVARSGPAKERIEAEILIVRRLALAISPILFTLLGSALILRFYRRGRGFGVLLALFSLLLYFLVGFAGEQLARSGSISPLIGGLLPLFVSAAVTAFFLLEIRFPILLGNRRRTLKTVLPTIGKNRKYRGSDRLLDRTTGIRDFELSAELAKYYLYSVSFLALMFIVFTVFDLWRFAGSIDGGTWLMARHVVFLVPLVYLQVSGASVLIAVIAVFTIKTRQNEIVTWLLSGESLYRLIVPCLILMSLLGILNFAIQEYVAVPSNVRQEVLRQKIRNRGSDRDISGKQWTATDTSIVSYELVKAASDNEFAAYTACDTPCAIRNIAVYNFSVDSGELQSVYRISEAIAGKGTLEATGPGEVLLFNGQNAKRSELRPGLIDIGFDLTGRRPVAASRNSIKQMWDAVGLSRSEVERRRLSVGLEKKYSTLTLPLVVSMIAIPFSIGIDRKRRVIRAAYAVGVWLSFVVIGSVFEQFGLNGTLPPVIAVWAPIVLFAFIGAYLISRVRT